MSKPIKPVKQDIVDAFIDLYPCKHHLEKLFFNKETQTFQSKNGSLDVPDFVKQIEYSITVNSSFIMFCAGVDWQESKNVNIQP